ncbi:MAG: MFS transporter [Candidatus Heimdallarchaeota archaeon]
MSTSLIHFLNHIALYAFPSVVIFIRDDISLSYSEIGVLAAIPTLLMVALTPLSGRTQLGFENYVILGGLFVMGSSIVLMSSASNIFDLALANVVLGIGGAAYHPPGFSMVSHFYEEKKGEALSINQGSGVIGSGIAPFSLVASAGLVGWRTTLVFCGGFAILIVPLSAFLLIGVSDALRRFAFHLERDNENQKSNTEANNRPLFLALLSLPIIIALFLAACRSTIFRTVNIFTVTLMNDFYGLSKAESGLASSIILLSGALFSFMGGRFSDRAENGRMKVLITSGVGTAVFSLLIVIFGQTLPAIVGITIFLLFVGMYFFAAANFMALLAEMVPPQHRTIAFSLNFSLGQMAGALAPIIFGFLLDAYGFTAGMLYLLFVSVGALLVIMILNRMIIVPQPLEAEGIIPA